MCKPVEEKWPDHTDKAQLAEEFVDFFQNKIQKIKDMLIDKLKYQPTTKYAPKLRRFASLMESQVLGVIQSLKSKSCKLDPIPTSIFKSLLPVILPIITKIVNLSLSEGTFCRSWKTAVVRPLLKKVGA